MKPSDYIRKGWCQLMAAKDINGHDVAAFDPNAVCWCLAGAIIAAYPFDLQYREMIYRRLSSKLNMQGSAAIVRWNDAFSRTQSDVVAVLESIGE